MIIDNFDLIRDLLKFGNDKDTFYFLQIMQRKKDGSDIKHNNRIINNYYITSLEYFDDRKDEIKQLCDIFQARAYINLNPCSFKKSCFYGLKEITDSILKENYRNILNLAPTLAGKYSGTGENKTWLIDYDSTNSEFIEEVRNYIKDKDGKDGKGVDKIKAIIPTKNGFHLITSPFDPRNFEIEMKKFRFQIELHKNNPTLLYFNKKEEDKRTCVTIL